MKISKLPVLLLMLLSLFSCNDGLSEQEKLKADMLENARRIKEVLREIDPDYQVFGFTEVKEIIYELEGGEDDIWYYYCKTTYSGEIPELTGVHLEAMRGVIDPASAEENRDAEVLDYAAVIYTMDGREYLCWTISPEESCVIEYTPGTVSEEEIRLMAESVA